MKIIEKFQATDNIVSNHSEWLLPHTLLYIFEELLQILAHFPRRYASNDN